MKTVVCPNNIEIQGVPYTCRFCKVPVHGVTQMCCAVYRKTTLYAPLCGRCAEALDLLEADTRIGMVHKKLVDEANMNGRPCDD